MNPHLPERLARARNVQTQGNTSTLHNIKPPLNTHIREYVREANAPPAEGSKPWLLKAEVPTAEEILDDENEPVQLIKNKLSSPWLSRKKYLETHYELLREDAISPLRDAVHQFKRAPDMVDDSQVAVYVKVHIAGFTFAPQGLAARIQFSTARAEKSIAWAQSKRLMSGTLVALTPSTDNFQKECIIAIVAARPLDNVTVKPPSVDLFFPRHEEIQIDPQLEFVMIEARSGYYEGSRHTLRALQKLHRERFPLAEHICSLKAELPPPRYLELHPSMNLSSAFEETEQKRAAREIDLLKNWPPVPEGSLDRSQWNALHQIFTTRLSIVQGPPGTGKTHVSVVSLRVLLENKSPSDPPILVATQTNHALDQILGHISHFEDSYIRLGGRGTNDEVKKHTVYEARKKDKVRPPFGSVFGRAKKAQSDLSRDMAETLAPLAGGASAHPLGPDTLQKLGVISPAQAESLVSGAHQWVSSSPEHPHDAMSLWLDRQLIPFKVHYAEDTYGFVESEDEGEYEQLKELEAEQVVDPDDEDCEHLRGPFRIVEDQFTCRVSGSYKSSAEAQLKRHSDLWDIPERLRGAVYRLLQERAKTVILERFRRQAQQYAEVCRELQVGKWERDVVLLQEAKIIGMTTTGFSKYRPLVASLKPKIVLIEEAAEVIESPVTAVCVESLEHLILVGDHQQLQGHCNVRELEDKFHLNVSMFERLVRNKIPFTTLTRQRRMDPEIRRALAPIYPDLEDHPDVTVRPAIPGMGQVRSFFFDHDWSEGNDSMMSKQNEQEAEFIVGFFCYLVAGGAVAPSSITVLTFYNGQRKLISKLLGQHSSLAGAQIRVATVDSYQGEENMIVLLSLVRSNEHGNIGFLEVANRVCVALSRAKLGFYVFGNARQLSKNPLWNKIIGIMATRPNRVGCRFPIHCAKHDRKSEIRYPRDWEGRFGCNEKCVEMLECGHPCPLTCHSFSHRRVICKANCKRPLRCGHACGGGCSQQCSCTIRCAEFARLSQETELTANAQPDPRQNVAVDQPLDNQSLPVEVRGNNSTENFPARRSELGPLPTGTDAARRRIGASQPVASITSSITTNLIRRLDSQCEWSELANGGVRNDDLQRGRSPTGHKRGTPEQSLTLLRPSGDAPDISTDRTGDLGTVSNEKQRRLKNGRIRHDHEYILPSGYSRAGTQEGTQSTTSASAQSGSGESHIEVPNLIDLG